MTRRKTRLASLLPLHALGIHFMAEAAATEGAGGAVADPAAQGSAAAGTGGGGATASAADVIPRSEAQKAFKDRDAAKTMAKLLAGQFGLDPATIRVVANPDDKENPFKLEGDGLDEAAQLLAAARQQHQDSRKKRMTVEEREREMQSAHQRDIQTRAAAADAERTQLESILREQLTVPQLRAAFAAEGAVDHDNTGNFSDLIALTKSRIKVDIKRDEDGQAPRVEVIALNEDGTTPKLDSKGNNVPIRQMVAEFLAARPHLRQSRFQPGPGAGGRGSGTYLAGGLPQDPKTRVEALADKMFAKPKR